MKKSIHFLLCVSVFGFFGGGGGGALLQDLSHQSRAFPQDAIPHDNQIMSVHPQLILKLSYRRKP